MGIATIPAFKHSLLIFRAISLTPHTAGTMAVAEFNV